MLYSKRDDVTGVWRTLHREELCDLYFSPNIIRVNQFRMRWGGHVAPTGERNVHKGIWWGNLKEEPLRRHMHDDRRILKWILKKWKGRQGLN